MKQNKNFNHPLMHDNFTKEDLSVISKFVKSGSILTQNKNVFRFEKLWSKWLGVKYSVFVNSGSSANYLTFACLKYLYGLSGEVIVPSLTWVSDVVSVIRNGFKPVFVDINLNNLSMNEHEVKKKINKRTKVIFITHAQGFNGFSKSFLNLIKKKNIILIEDVCESHGAKHKGRKLGTFGLISNFSFYYAHHLSTIEGGMICTNNKEIYEVCRILRGHGMLREVSDKKYEKKIIKKYKNLSPKFIFMYPGFNFRNNEIGAILGINQLKRLNKNIILRRKNFNIFLRNISEKTFFKNFNLEGNSNYAFPVILKTNSIYKRNVFEKTLLKNKIEFRRGNAGGGNQLRQPYLRKIVKKNEYKLHKVTEKIHNFGYYIGNYPSLKKNKIEKICKILNKFDK